MTTNIEQWLRGAANSLERYPDEAAVNPDKLIEAADEIARLRAENDHLAEVLARIAYEGLDDPPRAAHDALKATARPLQEGSRHE